MRPNTYAFAIYTPPKLDENYLTDPSESTSPLDASSYLITSWFLGAILKGDILPQSVIDSFDLDDIDGFIDEVADNWQEIFTYNWRLCICVVLGLILTLIVPIVGVCWCVAHAKGRCGAKSKKWNEGWGHSVQRQTSYTFFVVCWAFALWGVIWHFASNDLMGRGVEKLPENLDFVVKDTIKYLNNSIEEIRYWKEVNLDEELRQGFEMGLRESADIMDENIPNIMESSNLNRISDTAMLLERTMTNFEFNKTDILFHLNTLQEKIAPVEESHRLFVDAPQWQNILSECAAACQELLDQLNVDRGPISDPSFIEPIVLTAEDFVLVQRYHGVSDEIVEQVSALGGDFLYDNSDSYFTIMDDLRLYVDNETADLSQVVDNLAFEDPDFYTEIKDAFHYWFDVAFYCFFIPGILLSIILLLYAIGYMIGICSPVGSELWKKGGARFLCVATGMFFSLSLIFWLFTTLLFATGASVEKLACETLEEPDKSDLYHMLERDFNEELREALNDSRFENITWTVPDLLDDCKDGKGMYEVLHLDVIYDMSDLNNWRDSVDFYQTIALLKEQMNQTVESVAANIGFTDSSLPDDLLPLEEKLLPIDNDYLANMIRKTTDNVLDRGKLDELLVVLDELVISNPNLEEDVEQVKLLAEDLKAELVGFDEAFTSAVTYAETYNEEVSQYGGTIFIWMTLAFTFVERAPDEIREETEGLQDLVTLNFVDSVELVDWFANYSISYFSTDFGRCSPVYDIYQAGVKYTCDLAVDPLNSVWSGVGLTMVFFFPLIFLAIKVEELFRRHRVLANKTAGQSAPDFVLPDVDRETKVFYVPDVYNTRDSDLPIKVDDVKVYNVPDVYYRRDSGLPIKVEADPTDDMNTKL